MTRDEAIKVVAGKFGFAGASSDFADKWVGTFVALGMLKLDEPKKASSFWIALGDRKGSVLPHDIAHMLNEFDLKIVEK